MFTISVRSRAAAAAAAITTLTLITGCSTPPTTSTATAAVTAVSPTVGSTSDSAPGSASALNPTASPVAPATEKREFLFQIDRYDTANQGGQTLNMYFHYRYTAGIAESDIPNYEDLRTQAIAFMDAVDTSQNPYWETLNQQLCGQLRTNFPIEAISCQLQVYPDDRAGLPYEPGFHSSIDTIGDIDPLTITGPITTG